MQPKIKNALTIDLEDWYQGILQIDFSDWHRYENRLERNATSILNLLRACNIKATFFVLGYIAEKFPGLIELVAKSGHEIASHGYCHRPVFEQTPEEFREDVSRSKNVIEAITKTRIRGYRAPFFSIINDTLWALDILKELGFEYDSSIFPTKNFLYGIPDAPHTIYRVNKSDLIEFPLSVIKRGRINIPVCGGFYMRVMPYMLVKRGLLSFNRSNEPAVVYFHPWELDPEKPTIPMSLKWKIIHEYNISTMKRKIEQLIADFNFTTMEEVIFYGQKQ